MSHELMNKVLEVSGDFIKNLNTSMPSVVHEITNYFIFISVMALIKNLFFLLIVGLFYRMMSSQILLLNSEKETYKSNKEVIASLTTYTAVLSFVRGAGSLGAIIGLLLVSYPHIESIGKALYAPRIFILEMAKQFATSQKMGEK